jgi:hypothetical protein
MDVVYELSRVSGRASLKGMIDRCPETAVVVVIIALVIVA